MKLIIHKMRFIILSLVIRTHFLFPDDLYLRILYYLKNRSKLNLKKPVLFTEKLQWMKLYHYDNNYHKLVDKIEAKKYVANLIGEKYIIKTLQIWDNLEQLEISNLPNKFVLKTNCGGGNNGVVLCKDKNIFNIYLAKKILNSSFKIDLAIKLKEWPYRNLPKKIFAEEYIEDNKNNDLIDYKFYCFNGEPNYCQVIKNRNSDETIDFFDIEWNNLEFTGLSLNAKRSVEEIDKPRKLNEMIELTQILSQGFPFVRIDIYEVNDKIYFGEFTFFPGSGFGSLNPKKWNKILGDKLNINYND